MVDKLVAPVNVGKHSYIGGFVIAFVDIKDVSGDQIEVLEVEIELGLEVGDDEAVVAKLYARVSVSFPWSMVTGSQDVRRR